GQVDRLGVGEQPQAALRGGERGARRQLALATERRVVGEVAGERAVGIRRRGEGAGDLEVDQLATRRRQPAVGGPADQIVGEVVGRLSRGGGADHAPTLQLVERAEEVRRRDRGGTPEQVGGETVSERRRPGEEV